MTKAWVVAIAAVSAFACKGEKKSETADQVGSDKGAVTGNATGLQGAQNEKTKLDLVRVDDDKGVADLTAIPKPHGVAWIDAKGGIDVAPVDSKWPQLPAGDKKRVDNPKHVYPALAYGDADAKLDDPPPPEEEDKPDDGEDESGGRPIVLEEGKMGSKEPDRVEGQYKMKKPVDDPQLARQQAIEQARKAGILGSSALSQHGGAFASLAGGEGLEGVVDSRAVADLKQRSVVVLAVPTAPAAPVVDILLDHGGAIAVSNRGALKVLAFGFERPRDLSSKGADGPWVEVHIGSDGLRLVDAAKQTQTSIAWKNGGADRDALRDAYLKLRADRFKDKEPEVDALVVPGATTAQQLVDGLVALDSIGARPKALGLIEKGTDARLEALKKMAAPTVGVGQPNAVGDLDKALIRKAIKENVSKIQYCYEKALLAKPDLKGTVETRFLIGSTGSVVTATGIGVDPEVAKCVAGVVQKIKFPAPKGGGNVQVNYPFTFRPSGM